MFHVPMFSPVHLLWNMHPTYCQKTHPNSAHITRLKQGFIFSRLFSIEDDHQVVLARAAN